MLFSKEDDANISILNSLIDASEKNRKIIQTEMGDLLKYIVVNRLSFNKMQNIFLVKKYYEDSRSHVIVRRKYRKIYNCPKEIAYSDWNNDLSLEQLDDYTVCFVFKQEVMKVIEKRIEELQANIDQQRSIVDDEDRRSAWIKYL